jgi:hypothetical protein
MLVSDDLRSLCDDSENVGRRIKLILLLQPLDNAASSVRTPSLRAPYPGIDTPERLAGVQKVNDASIYTRASSPPNNMKAIPTAKPDAGTASSGRDASQGEGKGPYYGRLLIHEIV